VWPTSAGLRRSSERRCRWFGIWLRKFPRYVFRLVWFVGSKKKEFEENGRGNGSGFIQSKCTIPI